ncbi:hypothetical protein P170DRAFT_509449 [Aspergillus steynii IBT 23096]|uniref:Uncharacterized protein n=1 Tax=Aspergillus steynii IBT 23096 TaxID=1392250 RepID=A0A2I2G764_9EURO|nr:uncharacterized protein P170DRAFT_509449 [Aspergillus steynii IBT 23096]PLB48710.1 hypothetical protein P170DRAFT_509449 [Aspergillus steynii IBT 23096]
MHFKSFLTIIFPLLTFLALTNAVDLFQYTGHSCRGRASVCRNINQRVCCQSRNRVFASASSTARTDTDIHITWNQVGSRFCGRVAASANRGRCISGGSNLRGHSWCRLCRTITSQSEEQVDACTSTQEPDVLEIGSKWFAVNDTVSEDDKNALWALWQGEADDASVPQNLLRFETEAVARDEVDDAQVAEGNAENEAGQPSDDLPEGSLEGAE